MARKQGDLDRTTLRFSPQQVELARTREELDSGPLWGELNVLIYGVAHAPAPERWRLVTANESEEYWVSDLGHLAVWRERPARIWVRNGYPQAVVYWKGRKAPRAIHALVTRNHCGWTDGDEVVRHLNSNRLDNHANNLKPGTQAENMRDIVRKRMGIVPVCDPPAREVWKLSREYAGVRVSNLGEVTLGWWVAFRSGGYVYRTGRQQGKKKHVSVKLGVGKGARYQLLHRLVYEAFCGKLPGRTLVRHLNDDPHDNRLANLAPGTDKQNAEDRVRNGRQLYGEDSPNAKYTNEQRGRLLDLIAAGTRTRVAADLVGMKIFSAYQLLSRHRKGLPVALPSRSRRGGLMS